MEVTDVELTHALHEILLDTATSGHENVDHLVLAEVADVLAHTAGSHVRSTT